MKRISDYITRGDQCMHRFTNQPTSYFSHCLKVVVDYQRDIPQGNGETTVKRAFSTITVGTGGKCLQEVMVENGMAMVARLRQDDPRTEGYDAIVAAESAAKAAKKGIHSGGKNSWERGDFEGTCFGGGCCNTWTYNQIVLV